MYIDFVLKQSTKGNHTTISNGESPDQVSAWTGKSEVLSLGSCMLKLILFCTANSLPTT